MAKKSGPPLIQLDATKAEGVAAMGGTNDQIAAALGISTTTLKAIRKRDPSIDKAVQNGKDKADLAVVGALYNKAMKGDTTAMIFWLKNRRPLEWRDRHDFDHKGNVKLDGKLIVEFVETKG